MARWTDMVDAKPDPAPLRGGVEVHMLTYEPVGRLSIREGGDGWDGLPSATMLINFADESGSRSVFGALNQAFPSARCAGHVFGAGDPTADLSRVLGSERFATVDAVIFAGSADVAPPTLQAIVDVLRLAAPGLVIMVGDDCLRWGAIRGISGFVKGAPATTAATVMASYSLVAALSAPHTLTCLDHEDVGATLGTATKPAVLVEAVWLREDCRLVYVRVADSKVIGRARAMTCHLVAVELRLTEIRSMVNTLRADAAADCDITYQAPVNAYLAPFFHPNIALMTIICKGQREGDGSS